MGFMAYSVRAGGGVKNIQFMFGVIGRLDGASPSFSAWENEDSGRYHIKNSSVVFTKELILIFERGSRAKMLPFDSFDGYRECMETFLTTYGVELLKRL